MDRLLGTAGRIPGVSSQDPLACKALKGLLIGSSDGVVLATADPAGHIRCATVPLEQPVEIGDRDFIQATIAAGRFTIGGYVRSRLDGEGALAFAEPVRGSGGEIVGAALAYVSLDWLMSTMEHAHLLPGEDLVITDQKGVVLAHLPRARNNWIGKSLPGSYLAMLKAPEPGVIDMDDLDGRPAIYAYIPVTVPPRNIYVLFSEQRDIAFAAIDAAAQRALLLSAASVALGIFLAWRIAGKHVRRPVQRLLEVARQWREGNYSARTPVIGGCAELRQLGREFNSMANAIQLRDRQISAANRAKELTLATAGHDLRQPLQVVSSVIDLFSRRDLTDRERRYIQDAKTSIGRLTGGLDALVEMVRVHGDALGSHQEPFPVEDVLKELAARWSGKAIEKGLCFRVRSCGAVIVSNKVMLGTVLDNLAGNAIKYTNSGGVLIACRTRKQAVWIDVYDTGAGIAQDRLEKIFGKFQQLDPAQEGFGLGLWIARQTVEALGHEITVRCSAGKGSRFRVVATLAPHLPSN